MDIPGHTTRLQLSAAQTGGRLAVLSCELAPNSGPPPHRHTHEDEIFIVQSGSIEFFLNGEYLVATAGDVIFVSRGEVHGFRGLEGTEPNRLIGIAAPGRNFETFYDGLIELLNASSTDMERVMAHAHKHGMAMFPPHAPVEIPIVENSRSKVVRAGTKRVLDVIGGKVQILLSTQDTGGAYGLIHLEGPLNEGPPPHVHQREDETFFIERGSLEMWLNGETQMAHTGDIAWAPRHVPHSFRITSSATAPNCRKQTTSHPKA
jgi:quercetin dioxygenase-like cupin family protein